MVTRLRRHSLRLPTESDDAVRSALRDQRRVAAGLPVEVVEGRRAEVSSDVRKESRVAFDENDPAARTERAAEVVVLVASGCQIHQHRVRDHPNLPTTHRHHERPAMPTLRFNRIGAVDGRQIAVRPNDEARSTDVARRLNPRFDGARPVARIDIDGRIDPSLNRPSPRDGHVQPPRPQRRDASQRDETVFVPLTRARRVVAGESARLRAGDAETATHPLSRQRPLSALNR